MMKIALEVMMNIVLFIIKVSMNPISPATMKLVRDEGEQHIDDTLNQSQHIRYSVRQLIKRIRACVTDVRNAWITNDYVRKKPESNEPPIKAGFDTDLEIRWNTTFDMFDGFLTYRSMINDVNSLPHQFARFTSSQLLKLRSKNFEFTNDDWCRTNDLHIILKLFLTATNIVSAKNYPTFSTAYSGVSFIATVLSTIQ